MGNVEKTKKETNVNQLEKIEELKQATVIIDKNKLSCFRLNKSFLDLFNSSNQENLYNKSIFELSSNYQPYFSCETKTAIEKIGNLIIEQNKVDNFTWKILTLDEKEMEIETKIEPFQIDSTIYFQIEFLKTSPEDSEKTDSNVSPNTSFDEKANDIQINEESIPELSQINEKINHLKSKVNQFGNPDLEKRITENLTQIQQSIRQSIIEKMKNLELLKTQSQTEQRDQKKKYDLLEMHLQRRLGGMENEKKTKRDLLNQNLFMKKKIKEIKQKIEDENKQIHRLAEMVNELQAEINENDPDNSHSHQEDETETLGEFESDNDTQ
ncbi:hypothetical protein M0811_06408 [Anaeramoeba ignava]|uniref:Uncharacterized protein n=1 Tax=Anaeramoeba ignava TaxID=1746090 RepID=A0A9Q0RE86_ANAIG|nr:hypothetical protein M0811_06408 [Anaeramoeba ignava]|eukprot:Anaeramoba_ignava/a5762_96.p1 GENE.a5762_96~~a5762_96.p1  ORF type:complete len:325 (-),score=136.87 a5762_96:63-1037(-)